MDIEQYCKEHGMVMVDNDVWEDCKKELKKVKDIKEIYTQWEYPKMKLDSLDAMLKIRSIFKGE